MKGVVDMYHEADAIKGRISEIRYADYTMIGRSAQLKKIAGYSSSREEHHQNGILITEDMKRWMGISKVGVVMDTYRKDADELFALSLKVEGHYYPLSAIGGLL